MKHFPLVFGIIRNYIWFRFFLHWTNRLLHFLSGILAFSYLIASVMFLIPRVIDRGNIKTRYLVMTRMQCVKINLSGTITRSKLFPFTEIKIIYATSSLIQYYAFVTRHPVYIVVQLVGAAHEDGWEEGRESRYAKALLRYGIVIGPLLPRDPHHPSNYPQIH